MPKTCGYYPGMFSCFSKVRLELTLYLLGKLSYITVTLIAKFFLDIFVVKERALGCGPRSQVSCNALSGYGCIASSNHVS